MGLSVIDLKWSWPWLQDNVISYSWSIFYGVKKVNFEHIDFCIYKIYIFAVFSYVNLLSISIQYEFKDSMC